MWARNSLRGTLIRRATLPVLLLVCGGALVVYGAAFHTLPVVEEEEIERTITIPSPFQDPSMFPGQPSGFPQPPPVPGLPPIVEKVITTVRETKHDSEPMLIREATRGGVTFAQEEGGFGVLGVILLARGELKRTYSGEAPSLCPT